MGLNAELLVYEGWSIVDNLCSSVVVPANARHLPSAAGRRFIQPSICCLTQMVKISACNDYQAWVGDALRIEFWNDIPEDSDNSDMDLHLAHENASSFDGIGIVRSNVVPDGEPGQPNGAMKFQRTTRVDVDDTDGWGPENINIKQPDRTRYRIGVHINRNQNGSPAKVQVRVYCLGLYRRSWDWS